jgi:hypothetical protein
MDARRQQARRLGIGARLARERKQGRGGLICEAFLDAGEERRAESGNGARIVHRRVYKPVQRTKLRESFE